GEFKNKNKSGEYFWLWFTIVPFKNHQGQIEKFIAIGQEITEIKAHRDQVAKLQKLSAVGELSAKILHDTMNPLSIIKSSTYLMRKYLREGRYEKSEIILDNIDHSSNRIQDMFSILRENLSRKKNESDKQNFEKLPVKQIIDSSIRFYQGDPR